MREALVIVNKIVLPSEGEAFAVPLDDGRYTVCRVLQKVDDGDSNLIIVACSSWVGNEVPDVDNVALRSILNIDYDLRMRSLPAHFWVDKPVPKDLIPIGLIPPSPHEKENQGYFGEGEWNSIACEALAQWRWDNDREAFYKAWDEDDGLIAIKREFDKHLQERQDYLEKVTLQDLAKKEFFENWQIPSHEATEASRQIIKDTIAALLKGTKSVDKEAKIIILEHCVESFRELDLKYVFIETSEHEDIYREFEAILYACGLEDYIEVDLWWEK